jgi:hypothetical protein
MTTRPAASFPSGARRVFEFSLGGMLWSRRTIFMGLVVGSPVILALVVRVAREIGMVPLGVEGGGVDPAGVFGLMIWVLFIRFIVPVLGIFYGTALIADEVENKTITYLFTRPVRRGAVLVGKFMAYLACTTLVVLPSVMLVFFLIVPPGQIGANFTLLVTDLGLLALGLAAYGSLFALVGATMNRPLLVGLVFVFVWEPLADAVPGYVGRFTIAHHLQALVPHAVPSSGGLAFFQALFAETVPVGVSLLWLSAIIGLSLALAVRGIEHREYVLKQ